MSDDENTGRPGITMVQSNLVDEIEQALVPHRVCCGLERRVEALVLSLVGEHYFEAHLHGKQLPDKAAVLALVTEYVEKYTSAEVQASFANSVPKLDGLS